MNDILEDKIMQEYSREPDKCAFLLRECEDMEDDTIIHRYGDLSNYDIRSYTIICDRCGHTAYFRQGEIVDGIFLCEECVKENTKKEKFEKLINDVEDTITSSGWDIENICYAQTGTCYYTICKDEKVKKVRVADHGECYCNEDISIDTLGYTVDDLVLYLTAEVVKDEE